MDMLKQIVSETRELTTIVKRLKEFESHVGNKRTLTYEQIKDFLKTKSKRGKVYIVEQSESLYRISRIGDYSNANYYYKLMEPIKPSVPEISNHQQCQIAIDKVIDEYLGKTIEEVRNSMGWVTSKVKPLKIITYSYMLNKLYSKVCFNDEKNVTEKIKEKLKRHKRLKFIARSEAKIRFDTTSKLYQILDN